MIPVPEITKAEEVFPAHALDWMPAWEEIPVEFKSDSRGEWGRLASRWFALGIPADAKFYAKPGVDAEKAFRVIAAILQSYAPKHQHKMAAVAYLCSEWFEKVEAEWPSLTSRRMRGQTG